MGDIQQSGQICNDKTNARIVELDILRAVAVILVLGRHILFIPDSLPIVSRNFFLAWREVGWIGVDCFFVLSGFLVSGLLFTEYQKTGTLRLGKFLIRRGFKIYPPFYFFLLITFLASLIFEFPSHVPLGAFVGEIFFLQNYISAAWNHTWSLAIEEHFYILLAIITMILTLYKVQIKNPFMPLKIIGYTILSLLLGARIIVAYCHPIGNWEATLIYTHLRIDSLFFGVLISYFYYFEKKLLESLVMRWGSALTIPILFFAMLSITLLFPLTESRFMYSFGFTFLYLGFGGILLISLLYPFKSKKTLLHYLRGLIPIGQKSYSIYLWHIMVYWISIQIFPPELGNSAFYLQVILYLTGGVLFGSFMAKIIEFPALFVRDKYFPKPVTR